MSESLEKDQQAGEHKVAALLPKTFATFDKLSLSSFAVALKDHMMVEYQHAEGSLVLSLNGRFGCGKSSFLAMFQNYLEAEQYDVIHINVWESDFFNDPLMCIMAGIIDHLEEEKSTLDTAATRLGKIARTVMGAATEAGNQMITAKAGINIKNIIAKAKSAGQREELIGNEVYKAYKEKKELFGDLNVALEEYVNHTNKKPLVILVDELDRARPDYVVNFFEVLKHFFRTEGVVFILAVDKEQLTSAVKCLFGQDINFAEYYRKFVHRNIPFPKLNHGVGVHYIRKSISKYFNSKKRNFLLEISENMEDFMWDLCNGFNLSPRQMNEFFRVLSYFFIARDTNQSQSESFGWIMAAIIYGTILIGEESSAEKIRSNQLKIQDYLHIFEEKKILSEGSILADGWARILLGIVSTEVTYNDNLKVCSRYFYSLERSEFFRERTKETNRFFNEISGTLRYESIMSMVVHRIDNCLRFFE